MKKNLYGRPRGAHIEQAVACLLQTRGPHLQPQHAPKAIGADQVPPAAICYAIWCALLTTTNDSTGGVLCDQKKTNHYEMCCVTKKFDQKKIHISPKNIISPFYRGLKLKTMSGGGREGWRSCKFAGQTVSRLQKQHVPMSIGLATPVLLTNTGAAGACGGILRDMAKTQVQIHAKCTSLAQY